MEQQGFDFFWIDEITGVFHHEIIGGESRPGREFRKTPFECVDGGLAAIPKGPELGDAVGAERFDQFIDRHEAEVT